MNVFRKYSVGIRYHWSNLMVVTVLSDLKMQSQVLLLMTDAETLIALKLIKKYTYILIIYAENILINYVGGINYLSFP